MSVLAIEGGQQVALRRHSLDRQADRRAQAFVDAIILIGRIAADLIRIELRPQQTGVLGRIQPAAGIDHLSGQHNARRQTAGLLRSAKILNSRAPRRPVAPRGGQPRARRQFVDAGQDSLHGGPMIAKPGIARHRADERPMMHPPGHQRQVLANLHAAYRGIDRPKFAATLVGRFGFRIERVEMTRAAEQEHEQHRFGPRRRRRRRPCSAADQRRQPQSQAPSNNRPRVNFAA